MSESSHKSEQELERSWLSWFLIVLGVLAFLASTLAFMSGGYGFFAGFSCIATGGVLLALSRILDYLQAIVHRKDQADNDGKI